MELDDQDGSARHRRRNARAEFRSGARPDDGLRLRQERRAGPGQGRLERHQLADVDPAQIETKDGCLHGGTVTERDIDAVAVVVPLLVVSIVAAIGRSDRGAGAADGDHARPAPDAEGMPFGHVRREASQDEAQCGKPHEEGLESGEPHLIGIGRAEEYIGQPSRVLNPFPGKACRGDLRNAHAAVSSLLPLLALNPRLLLPPLFSIDGAIVPELLK